MGARRADWVDNSAQLLREGTEYFQVVFTFSMKCKRVTGWFIFNLRRRTRVTRLTC